MRVLCDINTFEMRGIECERAYIQFKWLIAMASVCYAKYPETVHNPVHYWSEWTEPNGVGIRKKESENMNKKMQ